MNRGYYGFHDNEEELIVFVFSIKIMQYQFLEQQTHNKGINYITWQDRTWLSVLQSPFLSSPDPLSCWLYVHHSN